MNQNCLICNLPIGISARNCVNIFTDSTTLLSGKKLHETISEIVEKPVVETADQSKVICKKCQKSCMEYDNFKTRLQAMKNDLKESYQRTQQAVNKSFESTSPTKPKVEKKKIVLPASKLQPVPANFIIKMENLAALSKSNYAGVDTAAVPLLKVANAVKASLANSQSLKNPTTNSPIKVSNVTTLSQKTTDTKVINNLAMSMGKNPVMSFNINTMPKDFLATVSKDSDQIANVAKADGIKFNNDEDDDDEQNGDEMEIDEDCSLAVVPVTADSNGKLVFEGDKSKANSNLFDMGLLLSPEGDTRSNDGQEKYILDKLQILNDNLDDDDDEEQTIVMENGSGTTIIRMGAGQKVMYNGEQFALVPAADDHDTQDSNDESQIELQVSGDEETANAIIAATQEQGGAFIKVESGEMFRVKSVQSKTEGALVNKMHLENIVEAQGDLFKCLLCEKNKDTNDPEFKPYVDNAEAIMAHLKHTHSARVYICQICGLVMRKKTDYTTHMEGHAQKSEVGSAGKVHSCSVCLRRYSSRSVLAEHMNTHTGRRPYTCTLCAKGFASKYTLQAHMKTHEQRPRPFKCQCGKAFFTQQNLTQHERTHFGIKEFICKVCDKAFATQHNLEVHCVVHSGKKPFSCSLCNKGFARKAEVKDHMRTHTGERPFECEICGATFTQRSNLHSHRRATHLGDKRHRCTKCPKRFKRRRLLEYHVKAAHTGERPFKCEVCHATFVYPEHYKKHARIHSGERPYVCEVCGKSFTSRDNRNTHRFVHSDKKPYECLACGAGYMRKQLLYAHMNTTGHVAEAIVVNQPRVIKAGENMYETNPEVQLPVLKLELNANEVNAVAMSQENATKLYVTSDKNIVLQDNSAINVLQDGDESAFLTLHNLNEFIETNEDDKLNEHTQVVTTDEKGGTMRLIQVQMEDGKSGWVAINN